jgi:hypothetical protein
MGEEDRQAHYMGFHRSSSAKVRPSVSGARARSSRWRGRRPNKKKRPPQNLIDAVIAPRCGQKSRVALHLLARGRGGRVACLSAQLPNIRRKPESCGTVARNAAPWRG